MSGAEAGVALVARDGEQIPRIDSATPLAVRGLTVAYNRRPALWNVDFNPPDGAMVAIVGPNGAGKSTLIKATLGLVARVSGEVACYGRPIDEARGDIAYVPQRSSVDWDFPASAGDVVLMGLYRETGWLPFVRKRHREAALHALDLVGMADFVDRQIGQLSGGQQQRVFLARALAQKARVYLMDEPFAGVDAATERAIVDVLRQLKAEGRTVISVHHDLDTVPAYFDYIMILNVHAIAEGPGGDSLYFGEPSTCLRRTSGSLATRCRVGRLSELAGAMLQSFFSALLLQAGFNAAVVSLGAAALGAAAGAIGVYVLLRRRALVSDAISHATLPGLGLAFIAGVLVLGDGRMLPLLLVGAAGSALVGVLAVEIITARTRLAEDTAIGVVLSTFFALGVVLLTVIQSMPTAGQAGLETFLLGATAGMLRSEAELIAVAALIVGAVVFWLRRPFAMVCFDEDYAAVRGLNVRLIDRAMLGLLLAVIVIGLKVVGLVLIIALAIIPAVAARFWSDRIETVVLVAAALGASGAYLGAALSASAPRLPTGSVIVLVLFSLFVVSLLVAPARGLFAAALAHRRFRLAVHLRQGLLSLSRDEPILDPLSRRLLKRNGFINASGVATLAGRSMARRIERDQALWNRYRDAYPEDAMALPDWSLRPIDEVLPADLVADLERHVLTEAGPN